MTQNDLHLAILTDELSRLKFFFFRIALLQTDIVRTSMPAQVIKKAKVVYVLRYVQMNFFYKMKKFKCFFIVMFTS